MLVEKKKPKKRPKQFAKPAQAEDSHANSKFPRDLIEAVPVQENIIREFLHEMKLGSEALLQKNYRTAATHYTTCESFVHKHGAQFLQLTIELQLVINYAHGMAYARIGDSVELANAVKLFKIILDEKPTGTIRAIACFGLGSSLVQQHRFREAKEPLKISESLCCDGSMDKRLSWPGLTEEIPETRAEHLLECLKPLLQISSCPPQPIAVCCCHTCQLVGHYQRQIYLEEPGFKGYVAEFCTDKCVLYFHPDCWKRHKQAILDQLQVKEVTGTSCKTPDCLGVICKYILYDGDGAPKSISELNMKTISALTDGEKQLKAKVTHKAKRLLPSSLRTIEKRHEAKKRRRCAKEEARRRRAAHLNDMVQHQQPTEDNFGEDGVSPIADTRKVPFAILERDRDHDSQNHMPKKRGSKVRPSAMSLGEFIGPTSTDDFDTISSSSLGLDFEYPFMIPPSLRHDVERFESEYHSGSIPLVINGVAVSQIEENLIEIFYDVLSANGPLHITDHLLTDLLEQEVEAKELVTYYGGMAKFLLHSKKFAMIEDVVCLLKDCAHARELADEFRRGKVSGVGVVPHDFKERLRRAEESSQFESNRNLQSALTFEPFLARSTNSDASQASCNTSGSAYQSVSSNTSISEPLFTTVSASDVVMPEEHLDDAKAGNGIEINSEESHTIDYITDCQAETPASYTPPVYIPRYTVSTPPPTVRGDALVAATSAAVLPTLEFLNQADATRQRLNTAVMSSTEAYQPYYQPSNQLYAFHPLAGYQQMPFGGYIPALHQQPQSFSCYPQALSGSPIIRQVDVSSDKRSSTVITPTDHGVGAVVDDGVGATVEEAIAADYVDAETLTLSCQMVDASCSTEFMDREEKMVEELLMVQQRYNQLMDNYTQLRNASSTELKDMGEKIADALASERLAKWQLEENSKKWKETKKKLTEELASTKKQDSELISINLSLKKRLEETEQLVSSFKSEVQMLQADGDSKEKQLSEMSQQLSTMRERAIAAELKVIDVQEETNLANIKEIIAQTEQVLQQLKLHTERLIKEGQRVTEELRMDVTYAVQRKKLLDNKLSEELARYAKRRESIVNNDLALPPLLPPHIDDILEQTAPVATSRPSESARIMDIKRHTEGTLMGRPVSVPELLYAGFTEDCVMCHSKHTDNIVRLECGHKLHKNCITDELVQSRICPVCHQHADYM